MKSLLNLIIFILALPLVLTREIFVSERGFGKKLLYFLIVLILFFSTWVRGYQDIIAYTKNALFVYGIVDRPISILVSGTSMLPTLEDNKKVILNSPKMYPVEKGDLVTFKNIETGSSNYVKRIIGMENDKVILKNGFVSINDKILKENYIFEQKPTFGNTFLSECESYVIPLNYYMVLGDNRTVSMDSRIIGFIHEDDINGVIKTHQTPEYLSENEQIRQFNVSINPDVFLEKLNLKRVETKVNNLAVNQVLSDLTQKRAEEISQNFNDWKRNGFSTEKILQENNYKYNLVHEFVTFGYLSEADVITQIMELPFEKEAFLSPSYMEIGIGVVQKTNEVCSFPVISIIVTWPTTPTYNQKDIEAWQTEADVTLDLLNQIQTYGIRGKNTTQTRQIIDNLAKESEIASRLVNKMKNNEWLSEQDKQDMDLYFRLIEETMEQLEIENQTSF